MFHLGQKISIGFYVLMNRGGRGSFDKKILSEITIRIFLLKIVCKDVIKVKLTMFFFQ